MKKLSYNTPVVEITIWKQQDIITTSGTGIVASVSDVSAIGDSHYTASTTFEELK